MTCRQPHPLSSPVETPAATSAVIYGSIWRHNLLIMKNCARIYRWCCSICECEPSSDGQWMVSRRSQLAHSPAHWLLLWFLQVCCECVKPSSDVHWLCRALFSGITCSLIWDDLIAPRGLNFKLISSLTWSVNNRFLFIGHTFHNQHP